MPEVRPRPESVLDVLAFQAEACREPSPLYGRILDGVVADLQGGGITADLLEGRAGDPLRSALPLRFLGAVHRIVLEGRVPDLARHYPSAGGRADGDPVPAFLAAVAEHRAEIDRRIDDGVQTNEVGRAAVLAGGYAAVERRTLLPLRVLEVGASAGLNLRFDHFAYDTGRRVGGDPGSPVRFADVWEGEPPELPDRFDVAERAGCDRSPIDATTEDGRLRLMSYVWPDQLDRLERLAAAIEVARRVPAPVERAEAPAWLARRLASPAPGRATVVTHSIVLQYLSSADRRQLLDTIRAAGERATGGAPLAWLRMEPAGERADLRLTTWPHGEERVLAAAGYHGQPIWWGAPTD